MWDANSLQLACSFSLEARVYAAAMSAVATAHCLVAVGSGDTQARLGARAGGGGCGTEGPALLLVNRCNVQQLVF